MTSTHVATGYSRNGFNFDLAAIRLKISTPTPNNVFLVELGSAVLVINTVVGRFSKFWF